MLILGETGTSKELFAKLIHRLSNRSEHPFIPINCGAIPKELVESILIGHKKGAFTGALSDQTGKYSAAHKGSLFLDELAELPVSTQSKLLRVLQDGMVEPLGSIKPQKVDVRIIAATNRDIGGGNQNRHVPAGPVLQAECRRNPPAPSQGKKERYP